MDVSLVGINFPTGHYLDDNVFLNEEDNMVAKGSFHDVKGLEKDVLI